MRERMRAFISVRFTSRHGTPHAHMAKPNNMKSKRTQYVNVEGLRAQRLSIIPILSVVGGWEYNQTRLEEFITSAECSLVE